MRHRYDVLLIWSIDRLGRSTAAVTAALEELQQAGVGIYADKEGMDATTAHGKAMLQMAAVFGELEGSMIRGAGRCGLDRARAAGKTLGRPKVGSDIEAAVRARLADGVGILKVARNWDRQQRCSTGQGRHGCLTSLSSLATPVSLAPGFSLSARFVNSSIQSGNRGM